MASDRDEAASGREPDRDRRLYEILAGYLEAVEAGRAPDRAEWLASHPEWAEELGAFLDEQDRLLRLTEPLRPVADTELTGAWQTPGGGLAAAPGPARGPAGGSAGYSAGTKVRYIGDYELLDEIARGGMGIVFRARQRSLNRPVALKMLLAEEYATEADEQRFRREAEAAANLDHPHIVPIYEVGRHEGRSYFSMKLVEGGSLAGRLSEFAREPRASARLAAMVAGAVQHAHQRGVLHRDLKPGNILLAGPPETPIAEVEPLVADFGLARRVEDDSGLTRSDAVVGSPAYMSPEQAIGKRGTITVATDVYGLGAVLYALLAGRPPFGGDSALETIARVKECDVAPPSRYVRRVDRDLETICLKCLEKDPARRYASAEAVAEDLDRWLAGKPIRARPAGRLERAWRWGRRHPSMAALVASVCLLFVAVAVAVRIGAGARRAAAQAGQEARDRRLAARRLEYVRSVKEAEELLKTNRPGDAIRRLTRPLPTPGEEDLREFTWRYLWRTAHLSPPLLRGHEGEVYSTAFSPDGLTVATAGQDRTVRLWDVPERRMRRILPDRPDHPGRHGDEINHVAYSPDGRLLATASDDGTVKIWDAASGVLRATLAGHSDRVVDAQFAPSGRELVSCGRDGTVIRWDVASSRPVRTFAVKNGTIQSLAISPDGEQLAIAGDHVVVLGLPDGREAGRFEERGPQVNGVAFSHDGRDLAIGNKSGEVRIWNAREGRIKTDLPRRGAPVESVAFAPDDRTLASGDIHGIVRLWDLPFGSHEAIRTGQDRIWCAAISGDGRTLATSSRDGTVQLRDLSRQRTRMALRGTVGRVSSIEFPSGGDMLAIAGSRGAVRTHDVSRGDLISSRRFGDETSIRGSALSGDAARLATVDSGGGVAIWDVRDGRRIHNLGPSSPPKEKPWLDHDGSRVITGGVDGVTIIRETATGRVLGRFPGSPRCAAFAPTGGAFAFAMWGAFRPSLCDGATGEVRDAQGPAHREVVASLAFSPDGRTLASGGEDDAVILWDRRTMEELARLTNHTNAIGSLAFSPDGRTLAAGTHDGTVWLWDVESRRELAILEGHSQPVTHLTFSPDGRTLASGAVASDGSYELFLWPASEAP